MIKVNKIKNTVINSDSIKFLSKVPSCTFDMVITSPPYDSLRDYDGKSDWNFSKFKKIANQLFRVLKEGGVIVWVVGDQTNNGNKTLTSFRQALYFQEIGLKMYDVMIYEKIGTAPPHPNRYFNSFEFMFVLSKGKPKTINLLRDKKNKWGGLSTYSEITRREKNGTLTKKSKKIINKFGVRTNIWKYANGKGFATRDEIAYQHPAIFPEKLVYDHLLSWSKEGDLILDPFSGSGTTGKVCVELKRNFVLIDAVEKYCNIAKKRIYEQNKKM